MKAYFANFMFLTVGNQVVHAIKFPNLPNDSAHVKCFEFG